MSIQNDSKEPETGPRNFWEFIDKWLHKLARFGERVTPVVKIVLIVGGCIYVALVGFRIWLISHAMTMFGVNITNLLPIDPNTAALIRKSLGVLLLFAPDAILAYILFNRHAEHWRTWTAVALACALGASWWATHEPGLGTHCYVITPDRGLIESYADKNGKCGIDRPTGLEMSPVTQDILLCIRAMKRGTKPHRLSILTVNADQMFDTRDGHSLYWFHQDSAGGFDLYDGPGFDQATVTPLTPITHQNAKKIRQYIKQQQETESAAQKKAAAERSHLEAEEKQAREKVVSEEKAAAKQRQTQAEQEKKAAQKREPFSQDDQKEALEREKQELVRERQELERQKALDAEREQLAAERRKSDAAGVAPRTAPTRDPSYSVKWR